LKQLGKNNHLKTELQLSDAILPLLTVTKQETHTGYEIRVEDPWKPALILHHPITQNHLHTLGLKTCLLACLAFFWPFQTQSHKPIQSCDISTKVKAYITQPL